MFLVCCVREYGNNIKIYLKMKNIVVVLLFFISITLNAQYPVDTYYRTILSGTIPPLPQLNSSVVDSSVPSPVRLTRITEYNADWDWYPIHEYAKIQPWNADGTIYKFYTVAIYDAATHDIIRELPGDLYPSYWSNTNPDLLYGFRENGDVKVYSVSGDSSGLLLHIAGYELIKLGPGEGNIDKNDKYVALVGKNSTDMDVIVIDLQTKSIVTTKTFAGAWGNGGDMPEYVDWVSVSQSGKYTGIMWDHNTTSESEPFYGHYGVEIYNTTDMEFVRRIAKYGNHGDFGFTPTGEEVFVQFWGEYGTVNAYYLDKTGNFIVSSHPDFEGEGHISCRNLKRPGWAYISIDEPQYGIIVAMKLDTSGIVEYFGHHFSSSVNYYKSPMPVPMPDGKIVMFKSDFGNSQNPEEVYCFLAESDISTSVKDNHQNTNNAVFPNPTSGLVNIVTKKNIKEINVYNILGEKVRSVTPAAGNVSLDIGGLRNGVYFINIKMKNNEILNTKIIKN